MSKFSVGDKVILTNPKQSSGHDLEEGWIGFVIDPNDGSGDIPVLVRESNYALSGVYFDEDELELLSVGSKQTDVVNSPKHYAVFDDIEAIEIIARSMTKEMFKGYCFGNLLKYRLRAGNKDELQQEISKANKYKELYQKYQELCQ